MVTLLDGMVFDVLILVFTYVWITLARPTHDVAWRDFLFFMLKLYLFKYCKS